jgi:hypothetical protein
MRTFSCAVMLVRSTVLEPPIALIAHNLAADKNGRAPEEA